MSEVQLQTSASLGVSLVMIKTQSLTLSFTASGSLCYILWFKGIYSFVEMVFVFLFLILCVVQEEFLKGERGSIFSVSQFKTLKYHCCQAGLSICRLVLEFKSNIAFRVSFLSERWIGACACLNPCSDFLSPLSYSWNFLA